MADLSFALPDEAATLALGAALAAGVLPGRVLHVSGELGSGKTTLVRGLMRALGHPGRVKSPSYPLVELYELSRLYLYHFDLYRFENEQEWLSSGFREYFNPETVCVVEWPERAGGLLPSPDLALKLEISGAGRLALPSAFSPAGRDWLASARSRFASG